MSRDHFLLENRNVVVVGGAGLLGGSICQAIVEAGAHCVIADVSLDRAETVAKRVESESGHRPSCVEVSITDIDSVECMISRSVELMGSIDSLVNAAYPRNANYGRRFEDVTFADFCENTNLHLGGYFLVSQRILEHFRKNSGGTLLNMSSIYGVVAPRFAIYADTAMTMPVEYAAVKAGLIHLTKYMAKYYAGNEIRVNSLSLGGLLDRQPESFLTKYREFCLDKGMLVPQDVLGCVLFLLSDASRYCNGQNLVVDDGFTL